MARWYSLALIAYLSASKLPAQPSVTIDGTVVDIDSELPIPGAKVILRYSTSARALRTVFADAAGEFRVSVAEPGTYAVVAGAVGYQEGRGGGPAIEVDEATLDSSGTPTIRTLTIQLYRSATIEGQVRDGDTREVMSLLIVRVLRVWWSVGKRQIMEERVGFTDDHGLFRFDELPSGEYLVEISKRRWESEAPDDSPRRYPILVWPDSSPDTLNPIPLQAGGEFKVGTIDYSRLSLPRVSIHLSSNCPDGGIYQLSISQRIGGSLVRRESRNGSCSAPLVIDSLTPGSYRFETRTSVRPLAIGVTERQLREGTDINLELQPAPIAAITGKVTCDCKPSAAKSVRPRTIAIRYLDGEAQATMSLRNDGGFIGGLLFAGTARIDVPALPDGTYIKSLAYNGTDSTQFITIYPGAPSTLEITISDRPAAVNGAVMKDGKPVTRGRVLVARWPLAPDGAYPDYRSAEIDKVGAFMFPSLPPGTYRVASISPAEWVRRDEPNVLASVLASGQELTLSEDQTSKVAIEQR